MFGVCCSLSRFIGFKWHQGPQRRSTLQLFSINELIYRRLFLWFETLCFLAHGFVPSLPRMCSRRRVIAASYPVLLLEDGVVRCSKFGIMSLREKRSYYDKKCIALIERWGNGFHPSTLMAQARWSVLVTPNHFSALLRFWQTGELDDLRFRRERNSMEPGEGPANVELQRPGLYSIL